MDGISLKQRLLMIPVIGLIIAALIIFPLSAANAQSNGTYSQRGGVTVGYMKNECMLVAPTTAGETLLVSLSVDGMFVIGAHSPKVTFTEGQSYAVTIKTDVETLNWKGRGIRLGKSVVLGVPTVDLVGTYNILSTAKSVDIDVGTTHIVGVNLNQDFRNALNDTVDCAMALAGAGGTSSKKGGSGYIS